ncbi:FkbM family methyltransferase [Tardiphaga sp. vice352]|uniref:FkbM family methyltransferase n=1 Tax=unclassified Tardiphaga TaxID=2631404 RepID=UPI00116444CA|nr:MULTISPECIES: FkbM family methyltransferase [unclassified Tardiphaga]QDM20580.1 FkbM family methyltransferase [Tardiphaga sp. vice154]QDM25708.1 FkbM family methyltransferase [Tardiphaga sp. vice304]QDM30922.1 FkbM family methyltransferase [Tardiphaga sp. vice352]
MEAALGQEATAPMGSSLAYDRGNGRLSGARLAQKLAVLALQAGSAVTQPFGHRGYRLGCRIVASAFAARDIVVRLNSDALFSVPFADGYWSRLLNRRYDYEEEIEAFLKGASDIDYVFVDCGANFGYWSVIASSAPFGSHHALAIEASSANAARLELNARLNGDRFRCIHAAVGGTSGGYVRITGARHEAFGTASIGAREEGAVRTVSLDALMTEGAIDITRAVVVKLDVEGVEIEALQGAENLLAGDAVFICEEHGADREHRVSRHLMGATSLRLYVFDVATSRFVRVQDLSVLDRIKRHAWVGYNVFATASALWAERLERIGGGPS